MAQAVGFESANREPEQRGGLGRIQHGVAIDGDRPAAWADGRSKRGGTRVVHTRLGTRETQLSKFSVFAPGSGRNYAPRNLMKFTAPKFGCANKRTRSLSDSSIAAGSQSGRRTSSFGSNRRPRSMQTLRNANAK